jgi:hypothetical protein
LGDTTSRVKKERGMNLLQLTNWKEARPRALQQLRSKQGSHTPKGVRFAELLSAAENFGRFPSREILAMRLKKWFYIIQFCLCNVKKKSFVFYPSPKFSLKKYEVRYFLGKINTKNLFRTSAN